MAELFCDIVDRSALTHEFSRERVPEIVESMMRQANLAEDPRPHLGDIHEVEGRTGLGHKHPMRHLAPASPQGFALPLVLEPRQSLGEVVAHVHGANLSGFRGPGVTSDRERPLHPDPSLDKVEVLPPKAECLGRSKATTGERHQVGA